MFGSERVLVWATNYANVLYARYQGRWDPQDLDTAIERFRAILAATPEDSRD